MVRFELGLGDVSNLDLYSFRFSDKKDVHTH